MTAPPYKFLRQDGWFQFATPADISISTSTTTGVLSFLTKATTAAIALSTVTYTDGPIVAQGSSGVWYATASVNFTNGSAAALISAKLWDGTTTIASGSCTIAAAGLASNMDLAGIISSPVGNLRLSAIGIVSAGSVLASTFSGNVFDSTITVMRIG